MKKTPRKILPDVRRVLDAVADVMAAEAKKKFCFDWEFDEIDKNDESPIEQMFSVGLLYGMNSDKHFGIHGGGIFSNNVHRGTKPPSREGFVICPQLPIGPYRADFFITRRHYTGAVISAVVECDGHEFHERTKEQARKDKARDRYLQSLGLLVLRYSGSEIFSDPVKCALDALGIIFNRADEAIRDGE